MATFLSKNWTLEELIQSSTADTSLLDNIKENDIDNTPDEKVKQNLGALARNILQPISDSLGGRAVICSSGYRCEKLNKLVGGSATSDHRFGNAADINAHGMASKEFFEHILKIPNFIFGQLILEDLEGRKWVHISAGIKRQVMKTNGRDANGKVIYVHIDNA